MISDKEKNKAGKRGRNCWYRNGDLSKVGRSGLTQNIITT